MAATVTRLWTVFCLLLLPALSMAEGGNDSEKQSVRITLNGGKQDKKIVLEASQAPLARVFGEITRSTGMRIHYPGSQQALVTRTCTGETAKRVMQCLLGSDADLMFRYSGNLSAWPAEAWVLGSNFDAVDASASSGQSNPGPDNSAGAKGEPSNDAETDAAAPEEIAKWLELTGSENPEQRASALSHLTASGSADATVYRNLLERALSDEDAEVRAQAVYGLAKHGGAETPAMLQSALHDGDASVRLMAVDSMGTDAEHIELLREALTDSDETVRTLAALKLEPLANAGRVQ